MFRSLIIVLIATSSIGSGIHAMSVSLSAQQCLIRNIIEEKRGTWTEAHAAAYYGFDDLLLEALNSTDPSVRTIDGSTPLHMAIERGNLSAARILMRKGAPIDACTKDTKLTPLHLAVMAGNDDAVKLLLENSASINALSVSGTPLIFACEQEFLNLAIVRRLCLNQADTNLPCPVSGHSPLDRLVLTLVPNYKGTDYLPSDVRNVAFFKEDPVDRPGDIVKRKLRPKIAKLVIQLLLAHGAQFNEYVPVKPDEMTVWHSLAQFPNNEILQLLLSCSTKHLNVLFDGETALDIAEDNEDTETTALLRSYCALTSYESLEFDEILAQFISENG